MTQSALTEVGSMDKKTKKKLETARQRLQKLRQQLAGVKKQQDEPDEVERLQKEMASVEAQIEKLKSA